MMKEFLKKLAGWYSEAPGYQRVLFHIVPLLITGLIFIGLWALFIRPVEDTIPWGLLFIRFLFTVAAAAIPYAIFMDWIVDGTVDIGKNIFKKDK